MVLGEMFANNTGGNDAMIGVVKDGRDGSDWVGHDAIGWSYYASNGNKYRWFRFFLWK